MRVCPHVHIFVFLQEILLLEDILDKESCCEERRENEGKNNHVKSFGFGRFWFNFTP